jgi:hypothetical protein
MRINSASAVVAMSGTNPMRVKKPKTTPAPSLNPPAQKRITADLPGGDWEQF